MAVPKAFDFSSLPNFIKGLQENGVLVYVVNGKFKTSPTVTNDESVWMYIDTNNDALCKIVEGK